MNVLILGSTGLTGALLTDLCLQHPLVHQVTLVTRKATSIQHPRLVNIVHSLRPDEPITGLSHIDVLFSCLGTTRKKTPYLPEYEHIEIGIPQIWIEHLIPKGLQQVHYISAVGVNPKSKNFYISIKNKAEQMLHRFADRLAIFVYRPSFIVGQRKENRWTEQIILGLYKALSPIFSTGKLRRYRHIPATHIAQSMLDHSLMSTTKSGFTIVENEEML